MRADKPCYVIRALRGKAVFQQIVSRDRNAGLCMIAALPRGNCPPDIVEYGRNHQVLIAKSVLICGGVVQPLCPAEHAFRMLEARIAEFGLVHADSALTFGLNLQKRVLHELQHALVIGIPEGCDGIFLGPFVAPSAKLRVGNLHDA